MYKRGRRVSFHGLVMYNSVVSDNLRKGAALNSIQIAEELLKRERLKPKTPSATKPVE